MGLARGLVDIGALHRSLLGDRRRGEPNDGKKRGRGYGAQRHRPSCRRFADDVEAD